MRAQDALAQVAEDLAAAERTGSGIERHASLVSALIGAGELLQGVADAEFADHGEDRPSPAQDALSAALMDLARRIGRSWRSGFATEAQVALRCLSRLAALPLPHEITCKRPEGYAFYALYPEAYGEAATVLTGAPARVVGLRSIGTSLAAMVAAGAGASTFTTLRPTGHPFRREIAPSGGLARRLLDDPAARFALVDEGPGLSGSSFGALADWLEDRGIAPERLHAFPSHRGGLGAEASPRHRERWGRIRRHGIDFDALVLKAERPEHRLETWLSDLIGPVEAPLQDLSGGGWRELHFAGEEEWPASEAQLERRKFLVRTARGPFLAKFAGLGRIGAEKTARAAALAAAGFTPEVAGFRHGFHVERWHDDASPLDPTRAGRPRLVETIGRYLGFRARRFPLGSEGGASLDALLVMARRNAELALGPAVARRLDRLRPDALKPRVRRIATDNRMLPWEWLVLPDGRFLKTDAVDHHAAHDLVGGQDVAWDVIGAEVELALTAPERERLCAVVAGEAGRDVDRDLLDLYRPCYLAFRLGASRLAADSLAGWPEEAARLRRGAERYAEALGRWV